MSKMKSVAAMLALAAMAEPMPEIVQNDLKSAFMHGHNRFEGSGTRRFRRPNQESPSAERKRKARNRAQRKSRNKNRRKK